MTTLYWIRDDLRLHDNPALTWAASRGEVITCVLDEPAYPGSRPLGSATAWWRERSLSRLAANLASYNVPLYRLNGDARSVLPAFAATHKVSAVCWNRRYHLPTIDAAVKDTLLAQGLEAHSFAAHCLVEPHAVKPFKVYSAFARAAREVLQDTMQPALEVPDLHGPVLSPGRSSPRPAGLRLWPSTGRLAKKPPATDSHRLISLTTTKAATSPLAPQPLDFHPTCVGARFPRGKSGNLQVRCRQTPRAFTLSCSGATSPGTASTTSPTSQQSLCGRSSATSIGTGTAAESTLKCPRFCSV